ncbi:hypothetical protein [Candidatus Marimicrobium litorale]|uniref:Uncharacterized protein n=1 Tax=Candidatus Marimicrobium litorale TaxID=2518991 RepID=A0ABT3T246_9GAMM|nr:hypothetical protein [Candidatus Marimicrobium litorale]MCX2976330.1 hypothetical protein [Candidatus Marimicrobium litorale]
MTYLLILFVVALALAPLSHFLPSKSQRRTARLREYAALSGLFVEFRDVPGAALAPRPSAPVIYYGKRLRPARGKPSDACAWLSSAQGWQSVGSRRAAPDALDHLVVEVLAVGADEFSCGIYWTESAGEDAIDQIVAFLEQWSVTLVEE